MTCPRVRTTRRTRNRITVIPARAILASLLLVLAAPREPERTIEITVRTRTGGALTGLVVDHNDHGVVLVHDQTPYVFSWRSLTPGSAYVARRDLLAFKRGGKQNLSAADRFTVGMIALDSGRNDLAAIEFRRALELDRSLKGPIAAAYDTFRERNKRAGATERVFASSDVEAIDADTNDSGEPSTDVLSLVLPSVHDETSGGPERSERIMEAYRTFGREVERVLGRAIISTETEHFLIGTDFAERDVPQLRSWCEAMYATLTKTLGLSDDQRVFVAKCPMFCFRSRVRFRKFAKHFDGFDARDSIGYTRSIESSGHTHVAILHQGTEAADRDRFACTLVHEGTHAFLHRLYSTRLIPHWVNEGFADLMADRVLGDRCGKRPDASLLARCFVRYDWSIRDMLESAAPIGVEQYPLAHSVVAFLFERGAERFTHFIEQLKSGATIQSALSNTYDGLTIAALEREWRAWVRASDSPATPEATSP